VVGTGAAGRSRGLGELPGHGAGGGGRSATRLRRPGLNHSVRTLSHSSRELVRIVRYCIVSRVSDPH
jgi:hypothetical protein